MHLSRVTGFLSDLAEKVLIYLKGEMFYNFSYVKMNLCK